MGEVKKLKGATDVRIQQRLDAPQIKVDINRKKAGALGITTDEVIKNIVSAVSSSSSYNPAIWVDPKSGIDYQMAVQFPEASIASIDQLAGISITGKHQIRSVPLGRFAKISKAEGPTEINHTNLRPVVDLYLDAQDRDVGSLSTEIAALIKKQSLPKGYYVYIRGEIAEMQKSVGALGGGFVLGTVLVYLILVVQFRSFLTPLIIMACVPMGLVGIIAMLALTNTYFSIQAAIGAIFMLGISVANAVLLIEFILQKTKSGAPLEDAIVDGAVARLRPIMMTSLASMLGLIPMAIGLGHGAEANIPLGRAVIGGQALGTVMTLFVLPLLFRLAMGRRAGPAVGAAEPYGETSHPGSEEESGVA
jgi:multidrug efflux pump subunit AcrB